MKKIKFIVAGLAIMAVPAMVSASSMMEMTADNNDDMQEECFFSDILGDESMKLADRLAGTVWKYDQPGQDVAVFKFEGSYLTVSCGGSEKILEVYESRPDHFRFQDRKVYLAMKCRHPSNQPIQLINGELYHGFIKLVRIG